MQYEELTRIATPEGVELELVLAGLASRFMAEIVDAALILLIVGAMIAVAALAGGAAGLVLVSVAVGGLMLISVVYHVAFEVRAGGQTPGKRSSGLRVVMDGGGPIGLRASAVRNLILLLEGPPLLYVAGDRLDPRDAAATSGSATSRPARSSCASRALPGGAGGTAPPASCPRSPAGGSRSGTSPRSRRRSWPRSARSSTGARRSLPPPAAGSRATWPRGSAPKVAGPPPGMTAEALLEGIAAAKSARS